MDELGFDVGLMDKAPRDVIFRKDTGMDSLDKVELIIECEKEFDISIHDQDAEDIETVGQLSDYIENKISNK